MKKFPNIDYFLKKANGESGQERGEFFTEFNKEVVKNCRCCILFEKSGEWPEDCEWGGKTQFCAPTDDNPYGKNWFDYTDTGGTNINDLLYILDHFGETFYMAQCLRDPLCSRFGPGGSVWPYWEDAGSCCLPDGTCATTTPLVCGLHNGDFGISPSCERKGSCCFQGSEGCEELTECECEKAKGSSWHDDGGDCGQGGGGNPCGSPAAPTDKSGGK